MATTLRNQVASIYAAAEHFALQGYYTKTTISIESDTAECCIFFHNIRKKERLIKAMQCFADEGDEIKFKEYERSINTNKFYTIHLIKEVVS